MWLGFGAPTDHLGADRTMGCDRSPMPGVYILAPTQTMVLLQYSYKWNVVIAVLINLCFGNPFLHSAINPCDYM